MPETVPAPTARAPLPATCVPALRGERLIVANREGCHYGYRAWSEVYTRPDGYDYVDVIAERDWWAHELLGVLPDFQRWPAGAVWTD